MWSCPDLISVVNYALTSHSTNQTNTQGRMKQIFILIVATALSTQAAQIKFALSPPGTDVAVGLSPSNEVPAVTNSTGSGNTISNGIFLDTSTAILHFTVGYGSAGGFTDLTGEATGMNIDGPAPAGQNANVLVDLGAINVPATNPALGGTIIGDIPFPTNAIADLLAGSNYVNILTVLNPGGEIRAQLIQVPNGPPSISCPAASTNECGTISTVSATVSDPDGDALTVVWSVNGIAIQTNDLPASTNSSSVSLSAKLGLGTNVVTVTATDTAGNVSSCTTTIIIVDTTPPVIESASATPNVLWPPNHKMVTIKVQAQVTDTCGPATWKILSVASSEAADAKGSGKKTTTDWQITGDHTLQLLAERSGKGTGRIYTITIQAKDQSGNTASETLTVTVPHDQGSSQTKDAAGNKTSKAEPHGQGNGQAKESAGNKASKTAAHGKKP